MAKSEGKAAAAAAVVLVAGVALGPDLAAQALRHSVKAWESVAYGLEAAALWAALFYAAPRLCSRWPAVVMRAACALGFLEGMARGCLRLFFPMTSPPQTGGQTLGQAALGEWGLWLMVAGYAGAAWLIIRGADGRTDYG